jgi:nucleoside-diphosphate-sugar epimerase
MSLHVIVGAGAIGSTTARLLVGRGERVRLITRRGGGPEHPAIERVAADAVDADRLTALTEGAAALYNCANPQYHRWLVDWPPLAAALLSAAERTGAVLAITGNLYGYGPVRGPITADTPLAATHPKLRVRADMWRDALAAHQAGRARVSEVRGSDYLQANSLFSVTIAAAVLAGRRAYPPVPLDVPHSWTSVNDVAATLVAAAGEPRAWGSAWLVPSGEPLTLRELAAAYAAANGLPPARLMSAPYSLLWTAGLFSAQLRELRTTYYQFRDPFVLDACATVDVLGVKAEPLEVALRDTAAYARRGA